MTNLVSNLSPSKIDALQNLAKKLNVPFDWIATIIHFETAGTFNPQIVNSIGATGLIQFLPDSGKNYKTIDGKKYLISEIKKLSFESQCHLIFLYFKPYISKIKNFIDCYLVVFYPSAIGKNSDFQLGGSVVAKQNPAFNTNKDSKLTISELETYFEKRYKNLNVNIKKKI